MCPEDEYSAFLSISGCLYKTNKLFAFLLGLLCGELFLHYSCFFSPHSRQFWGIYGNKALLCYGYFCYQYITDRTLLKLFSSTITCTILWSYIPTHIMSSHVPFMAIERVKLKKQLMTRVIPYIPDSTVLWKTAINQMNFL